MDDFALFVAPMVGLPVSAVWRGHGGAIFLELGVAPVEADADERRSGAFTLMIDWSWRIEGATAILGGSDSDDAVIEEALHGCVGRMVERVELYARLHEIAVALSGDRHVVSFMTADGCPEWTVFDNRGARKVWAHAAGGTVVFGREGEAPAG